MNPGLRTICAIAVALGICGVFAWEYYQNDPKQRSTFAAPAAPNPVPYAKVEPKNAVPKGKYEEILEKIDFTKEEAATKPPEVNDANWRATVFLHRVNVKEMNGKVLFFGKVVDQDFQEIEGVQIRASSAQYVESLKEQIAHGGGKLDTKTIEVATNSEGRFAISGYRARNLRFESVQKPGYISPEKLPGPFPFSPAYPSQHHANDNDPVIFQLWKQGADEPVIKMHWQKRMVPDGRVYSFDLKNSRFAEDDANANLRMSVVADYSSMTGTSNYPWTIKIEAPGGGVIVADDPYPYRAPATGYESHLTWNSENAEGEWKRDGTHSFYIMGPGGEFYASAQMRLIVFHTNSASLTMDTVLNPSGSRNLR